MQKFGITYLTKYEKENCCCYSLGSIICCGYVETQKRHPCKSYINLPILVLDARLIF